MNHNIGDMNGWTVGKVRNLNDLDDKSRIILNDYTCFFTVNSVEENKKMHHLLSGLGTKTYAVLKNLTAPAEPSGCYLAQIKEKLVNHFKLKLPVISERFLFHKHDQLPESQSRIS